MRRALSLLLALLALPVQAAELVSNGGFADLSGWWWTPNLTPEATAGALCVTVPAGLAQPWDAALGQQGIALAEGQAYRLGYALSGDASGPVRVVVQEARAPWTGYARQTVPAVLPQGVDRVLEFTAPASDAAAQIAFHLGGAARPRRLCLRDVSLTTGAAAASDLAGPAGAMIRANQLGYLPDGPKRATFISDSPTPLEWRLASAFGVTLARGQTRVLGPDAPSGLPVHLLDASAATFEGPAQFHVAGQATQPFAIDADLYDALWRDAAALFYVQRSGLAIDGALAGDAYARPAGHLGAAPNLGDTRVPCQDPAVSRLVYGVPWTCDDVLDVSGGWYDAGDHGKYVVNGGIAVAQLLSAYERDPSAFADGDLAIPEAGNGLPDLLDEARWELEFLMRMQVPQGRPLAGMAHHKVHDDQWTGLPMLPHRDPMRRSLHRPSTAATLNLAAAAAQGARLFRDLDPAFADRLLTAARRAWDAARANPVLLAPAADQSGGGPYDDSDVDDERFWAATELYLTTREAPFLEALLAAMPPDGVLTRGSGAFGWRDTAGLALLHLLRVPSDLPLPLRDSIRAQVLGAADRLLTRQAAQGWGQVYDAAAYDWGSNHLHLQNAIVIATAWDITGDPRYRDAALEAMDYLLGRNPLALSYITGYGPRHAQNQHSRWLAAQLDPELPHPPRGTLAGGPNSGLQDPLAQGRLAGCAPMACYIDHIDSWSTNELAINWNAALVHAAAMLADM